MVTTLLLFLSSVLSGVFFLFPHFFSQYFFLLLFFGLGLFSAAQTHNTSTTVISAPPAAWGQFSEGLQLINMLLPRPRRRWDKARGLPTFIFSYNMHLCRVISCAAVTVPRSWKSWRLLVPNASPWMLHATQTGSCCAHRKRTMEQSFNAWSALSALKEEKYSWLYILLVVGPDSYSNA